MGKGYKYEFSYSREPVIKWGEGTVVDAERYLLRPLQKHRVQGGVRGCPRRILKGREVQRPPWGMRKERELPRGASGAKAEKTGREFGRTDRAGPGNGLGKPREQCGSWSPITGHSRPGCLVRKT